MNIYSHTNNIKGTVEKQNHYYLYCFTYIGIKFVITTRN